MNLHVYSLSNFMQGSTIIRQPKRKAEVEQLEECDKPLQNDAASDTPCSMPANLKGLEVLHEDIIQEKFWVSHPEILR